MIIYCCLVAYQKEELAELPLLKQVASISNVSMVFLELIISN
jgi:hypothetical protein